MLTSSIIKQWEDKNKVQIQYILNMLSITLEVWPHMVLKACN
jgi:hypothetical protein